MENNFTSLYKLPQGNTVINQEFREKEQLAADLSRLKQSVLCEERSDITGTLPFTDTEQELAILFLDIRNFTGLMESRPAKEVIQVVHRLFSMFNKIIKNFSGTVVEIAGDSLYAVFGFGTNLKEAINQSYQATRMIFETISLFNEAFAVNYLGRPLEIGAGLHTGNVVVGRFELGTHEQLSVMGLPVNIASRLQAKTKELNNDLIISEEAYQLLHGHNNMNHQQRTVHLQGISSQQQIRLLGKPYSQSASASGREFDLNYVLAISG